MRQAAVLGGDWLEEEGGRGTYSRRRAQLSEWTAAARQKRARAGRQAIRAGDVGFTTQKERIESICRSGGLRTKGSGMAAFRPAAAGWRHACLARPRAGQWKEFSACASSAGSTRLSVIGGTGDPGRPGAIDAVARAMDLDIWNRCSLPARRGRRQHRHAIPPICQRARRAYLCFSTCFD